MFKLKFILFLGFLFCISLGFAQQVPDSLKNNQKVKLHLESGSVKSGYLIYDNETDIKIWSPDLGLFKVSKAIISKVEYLPADIEIVDVKEDISFKHAYSFSNSALSVGKGNMYVRLPYFFTGVFDYGLTENLTVGLNIYYFIAMSANVRYKFKFSDKTNLSLSVGNYYTYFNGPLSGNNSLFTARAVYTVGDKENNFSVGVNYLTNFKRVEFPIVTFAAIRKLTKRSYFVADLNFISNLKPLNLDLTGLGAGFLGFRIITKKERAWDLGVSNTIALLTYTNHLTGATEFERFYVPIPYVQYSFKI